MRQGQYGITKWQFEALDDIDLLCEISIFSSCCWPGVCRVCKKFLRWCIQILLKRWNYTKYIDFFDALALVRGNRQLFNSLEFFDYWRKDYIQHLIYKYY